jgi:hypothetical protein
MAQAWVHVGAVAPADATEVAVGSAVAASTTWQAKVWVANRTAGDLTFRVRQAYADAGADNTQYRAYDANCPANDIVVLPIFEVSTTDRLYFKQSAAGLTCIIDALAIT